MASFSSLNSPTPQKASLQKCNRNSPDEKWDKYLQHDEVKAKQERRFWQREWLPIDVLRVVIMSGIHLMFLYVPFYFTWEAFMVASVIGWITGVLGITLSYHRNLTHRSFSLPSWLEYVFAYCGALALEGHPIDWVSTHRYHHKFSDSERDPHSPIEGFLFGHICWIFDRDYLIEKCGVNNPSNNVGDLKNQAFYRFLEKTYYIHPLSVGLLLYAFGGLPYLVLGLGGRVVIVWHITYLVNSVCHLWGEQSWNTRDSSRNNWLVALLTSGEGWHNNHHAFEYSARHGLEWWQLDVTWWIIRLLEALGLATDVKVPTEAHKKRMAHQ